MHQRAVLAVVVHYLPDVVPGYFREVRHDLFEHHVAGEHSGMHRLARGSYSAEHGQVICYVVVHSLTKLHCVTQRFKETIHFSLISDGGKLR